MSLNSNNYGELCCRLCNLHVGNQAEFSGVVDRTQMYSEVARRQTFAKWPHMNYRYTAVTCQLYTVIINFCKCSIGCRQSFMGP